MLGMELNRKCQGQHRHIELTGSGRTKKAEVYPDDLCKTILSGLVKQMTADDRLGCSFKADEVNFNPEVEFVGGRVMELKCCYPHRRKFSVNAMDTHRYGNIQTYVTWKARPQLDSVYVENN